MLLRVIVKVSAVNPELKEWTQFSDTANKADTSSMSSDGTEDVWTITEEQREYYINQFRTMQKDIRSVISGLSFDGFCLNTSCVMRFTQHVVVSIVVKIRWQLVTTIKFLILLGCLCGCWQEYGPVNSKIKNIIHYCASCRNCCERVLWKIEASSNRTFQDMVRCSQISYGLMF